MDYEKKYKEALEWARKVMQGKVGFVLDEVLEKFPELKESEDERILRCLKEIVDWGCAKNISVECGVSLKDVKSWLEKNGEQNPVGKIQLGKKYKCIASPRYSTFMKGKIYKPEDKFLCSLMNFCSDCFEPIEDGEQKLADKVEPKFHKGDWVVYCNDDVDLITGVEENGYCINNSGYIPFVCASDVRLWTIQDAKDGDVLCCENGWTCIFKCLHDNLFDSHCFMDAEGWFSEDGGQAHTLDNRICGEIHPATKEQRDLLFQKMKETGYVWDAEKKELKKIEQKPTDKEMIEALRTEYEKGRADAIAEVQKSAWRIYVEIY